MKYNNLKIYKLVRTLAQHKNVSLAEIERTLNFSNGLISTWKNSIPSVDKIVDVADFFKISVDDLLCRNIYNSSDSDDVEIMKKVRNMDDTQKEKLLALIRIVFE